MNAVDPSGMWSATATWGVVAGTAGLAASSGAIAAVAASAPFWAVGLGLGAVTAAIMSAWLTQRARDAGDVSRAVYQVTMGMNAASAALGLISVGAHIPVALGVATGSGGCAAASFTTGILGAEVGFVATVTGICSGLFE